MFIRDRRPSVLIELVDLLEPLEFEFIRSQLFSGVPMGLLILQSEIQI